MFDYSLKALSLLNVYYFCRSPCLQDRLIAHNQKAARYGVAMAPEHYAGLPRIARPAALAPQRFDPGYGRLGESTRRSGGRHRPKSRAERTQPRRSRGWWKKSSFRHSRSYRLLLLKRDLGSAMLISKHMTEYEPDNQNRYWYTQQPGYSIFHKIFSISHCGNAV